MYNIFYKKIWNNREDEKQIKSVCPAGFYFPLQGFYFYAIKKIKTTIKQIAIIKILKSSISALR